MASVLGVTALLGAMRCGAGDPPPQGDDGGSGGGMNGITSPVKHRTSGIGGFSRFSVLLTMLLLVLGLAGTAGAQSTVAELEDGGAIYFPFSSGGATLFLVVIKDSGGGTMQVEAWEGTVGIGGTMIGMFTGVTIAGGNFGTSALTFTGTSDDLEVHIGTNGDDVITTMGAAGGFEASLIFGMDGSDVITGDGNPDVVFGGDGDDYIETFGDDDFIWSGFRSIRYGYNGYFNYVDAGSGMDVIECDDCGDEIHGGSGDDFIVGGAWIDELYGDSGDDAIWGGGHDDYISGGANCDNLFGDEDDLFTGPITGSTGSDIILGGDHDDFIRGHEGGDFLFGEGGDDAIDGGHGVDEMYGDDGIDYIFDGDGTAGDLLDGGANDDFLHSNDASPYPGDTLDGGTGSNSLFYDDPNDQISNGTPFANSDPSGFTLSVPSYTDPFEYYVFGGWWGSTGVAGTRTCA